MKMIKLIVLCLVLGMSQASVIPNAICSIQVHRGNCVGGPAIQRYYHDPITHECLPFDFHGCSTFDSNENNFATKESCEKLCIRNDFVTFEFQPNHCKQPREIGPCKSYVESYYYNKDRNSCEKFGFGGCHGNDNRFDTLSTCIENCVYL